MLATLSAYTVLGVVCFSGKSKEVETAAIPSTSASTGSSSGAIPSIVDEAFDEWSKIPGNLAKWEKSLDDFNGQSL